MILICERKQASGKAWIFLYGLHKDKC